MHLRTLLHSPSILGLERDGFVTSCLTIQQKTSEIELLKDVFVHFQKYPTFTLSDPARNYSLSIFKHEGRHFHDFIESPSSLQFILSTIEKWSIISLLLHVSNIKNVSVSPPAIQQPDKIRSLIGDELTVTLFSADLVQKYFLDFVEAEKQSADMSKHNFLVPLAFDPFPPLPALVTRGLVIPINLRELFEGSAVLSQLSWICSSLGSEHAKQLWDLIERTARREKQFQYVACLWALQEVFDEDSIFVMDNILAFRKIFRFSMYGSLPEYWSILKFGCSETELVDLPHSRFLAVLNGIKLRKLQKAFFSDPVEVIEDIANQILPNREEELKKFKRKLADVARDPTVIRPEYVRDLEFETTRQILNLYHLGVTSDHREVDRYFDVLWNEHYDDYYPRLLEPPIQICGFEKGKPLTLARTDDYGDPSLWLQMYILECLVSQFLHREEVFCPFSYLRIECEKALRGKVLLYTCTTDDCVVKSIAEYIGIRFD